LTLSMPFASPHALTRWMHCEQRDSDSFWIRSENNGVELDVQIRTISRPK
jgi:hypothetical protein